LYVIGGGDLGTKAADLDAALERVFDVATAWKAIVLIDEVRFFDRRRASPLTPPFRPTYSWSAAPSTTSSATPW
jgi:hypothetical protein